jgi:hypothetical protein
VVQSNSLEGYEQSYSSQETIREISGEQFDYVTDDKNQCLFTYTENIELSYERQDVFGHRTFPYVRHLTTNHHRKVQFKTPISVKVGEVTDSVENSILIEFQQLCLAILFCGAKITICGILPPLNVVITFVL